MARSSEDEIPVTPRRRRVGEQATTAAQEADDDSDQGGDSPDDVVSRQASESALKPSEKKSMLFTYLLYFTSGWFGLHLFYLGRDFQAFLSIATFGRFGLGLFLDLLFIPQYVSEANEEPDKMYLWRQKTKNKRVLSCSFDTLARLFWMWMISLLYLSICQNCWPPESDYYEHVMLGLEPLAVAVSVWLVGNMGITELQFGPIYFIALSTGILMQYAQWEDSRPLILWPALFAGLILCKYRGKKEWSSVRRSAKRGKCKRVLYIAAGMVLLSSLWTTGIIMSAEITNEDGQPIKLREALWNFYNSPAWNELMSTLSKLWEEGMKEESDYNDFDSRWERFSAKFKDLFDVDGERRALLELDLPENASDDEVKSKYRKLAKQYHPDRNRGNEEKASAKFMKIQEAYESLQRIRDMRKKSGSGGQKKKATTFGDHFG